MRSSHALGVFVCTAAIAGGALAASAAVLGPDRCILGNAPLDLVQAEAAEWSWPSEGLGRIHIEASGGPLRVIGVEGGPVRVFGAVSEDAAPLTLDADDGVLRIGYKGASGPAADALVVEAPRHLALTVRSASGAVECRGLTGGVEVQSLQGGVRLLDVGGAVAADVSAGAIAVQYGSAWTPDSAVRCKTVDGAVDIALPADSSFDLAVDTVDGRVTSDFAGLVQGAAEADAYRARVGAGGAPVVVDTLDGPVAIRRLTAE